jgi:hypothetical protein
MDGRPQGAITTYYLLLPIHGTKLFHQFELIPNLTNFVSLWQEKEEMDTKLSEQRATHRSSEIAWHRERDETEQKVSSLEREVHNHGSSKQQMDGLFQNQKREIETLESSLLTKQKARANFMGYPWGNLKVSQGCSKHYLFPPCRRPPLKWQ